MTGCWAFRCSVAARTMIRQRNHDHQPEFMGSTSKPSQISGDRKAPADVLQHASTRFWCHERFKPASCRTFCVPAPGCVALHWVQLRNSAIRAIASPAAWHAQLAGGGSARRARFPQKAGESLGECVIAKRQPVACLWPRDSQESFACPATQRRNHARFWRTPFIFNARDQLSETFSGPRRMALRTPRLERYGVSVGCREIGHTAQSRGTRAV